MAGDLLRPAHSNVTTAVVIFQVRVNALGAGSLLVAVLFGGIHFLFHSAASEVVVDERNMAEPAAVGVDFFGVVGRVHEVVETGDAHRAHLRERNRRLRVVQGSRSKDARDRDVALDDVEVELEADPAFLVALGVFLGADCAVLG